jgi:rfaE bifunctional protein kinase chain/domain
LKTPHINQIFAKIKTLKVAVMGDFALDLYYHVNQNTQETSVETGKTVFWAQNPISSLGGAGNVCANLVSLGAKYVSAYACLGQDLFGREMLYHFGELGVKTSSVIFANSWNTCTYTKPISYLEEQNRIDFGANNELDERLFSEMLLKLEQQMPGLDVLIINQQFQKPLLTAQRIAKLNTIFVKHPQCTVLADLRTNGLELRYAILKVNTDELTNLLKISQINEQDTQACITAIKQLSQQINCKILLTRGAFGSMFYDQIEITSANAHQITKKIDTVGAGDTVVAAFALAYQTGVTISQALQFANLAAAVTVQKLNQTGTATSREMISFLEDIK